MGNVWLAAPSARENGGTFPKWKEAGSQRAGFPGHEPID